MAAVGIDAAIAATVNAWLANTALGDLCDGLVRLDQTGLVDQFDGDLWLEEEGLHYNAFAHGTIAAPMLAAEINRITGL